MHYVSSVIAHQPKVSCSFSLIALPGNFFAMAGSL